MQHAASEVAEALQERLDHQSYGGVGTTAITLEEQSRSWLGLINRYADVRRQVTYYDRFIASFRFFAKWRIVPFDDAAAARFQELRL